MALPGGSMPEVGREAEALIALDPVMDNAMAGGDGATLGSLLAPDFVYTHANGTSQAKDEFIDAIVKRENRPRRDLSEIAAEVHGDVGVTRGNLDVVYYDDRPTLHFRYVRVYRRNPGGWQPISHRTVYAKDRETP
jgi:ketosteroid isomerase-like protein